jgi:EmrB/QacA subfamily drug resistance transporter
MKKKRVVILIVAAALFMQSLDSTVLGTALPAIAASLGTDPVRLHMTMTGYLLSLAVFMPVSGWLADRYGARNIFRLAVAVFTLASVACALAPTLAWLVAARVVQGMGGALMLPVARLALLRSISKHELVNAMSWVAIPGLVGPVLGPPVGGFVVTYWNWPWIFLINVPVGLLGIALATFYMEDVREADVPPLDVLGFVLTGIGFCGLVLGLEAMDAGLLPRSGSISALAVGLVALLAYVRHARRVPHPVLDLSLLRVPTFFAGVVGGAFFRVGVGALPFLLPLMLQAGFGYSPLHAGLVTVATALGALTMKLGAEALINRFGFRRTLIWNSTLAAISVAACMFFTPATSTAVIFATLAVGGFFRSLTFTAVNAISYADIDQRRMSQATGFAAVGQQLSLSLGVGLAAMILYIAKPSGAPPTAGDFVIAFAVVGIVMLVSAVQFATLSPQAGDALSRRRGQKTARQDNGPR